jgi:hypothetical protein
MEIIPATSSPRARREVSRAGRASPNSRRFKPGDALRMTKKKRVVCAIS